MNSRLFSLSTKMLLSLGVALSASACVQPADDGDGIEGSNEDVAEADSAIQNGTAADPWIRARVASLECTGSIIGPRHILTAAHCKPAVGKKVYFYTTTDPDYVPFDSFVWRKVETVTYPAGVDPYTDDLTDINGEFADLAILRLDASIPATSAVATMAWTYPAGGDDWGVKVGEGHHDGGWNTDYDLRSVPDQTYSDNDGDGHFLTENEQCNPGDSGGPFFYSNRVLGVLWGKTFEWEYRNKYTSVPAHLPFILNAMNYTFPGSVQNNTALGGTTLSMLHASTSRECSYICDKTSSCVGFNFTPANATTPCQLKSSNAGSVPYSGVTSGVK